MSELEQRMPEGCEVDQGNLDILCVKNAQKKHCENQCHTKASVDI